MIEEMAYETLFLKCILLLILCCGANHHDELGPNGRRPLVREAEPGCSYLLIIITASLMAVKKCDRPSARQGQLMMTRDDLQLLTSCCSRSDVRTLWKDIWPATH